MKKFRKIINVLMLTALLAGVVAMPVFAGDEVITVDDVANQFGAGQNVALKGDMLDGIAVGYNVSLTDATVAGTTAMAGYNVALDNTDVAGSLFAAGYNIAVTNSKVNNNIIAAGYSVSLGEGSSAKKLSADASNVTVDGMVDYADISAQTVIINGTINNNAKISAEEVIFGDNASVIGNLTLETINEPVNAKQITAGEYNFTQMKVESDDEAESKNTNDNSIGSIIIKFILGRLYWIAAMLIIGLVILIKFDSEVNGMGYAVMKNTGKTIGLGFATLAAVPLAAIILGITVIGLPLAAILIALYVIVICISQTFAGLSLGRIFIGKYVKNEKVASVLGVILLLLVDKIPYVGSICSFACIICTFGYIVLKMAGAVTCEEKNVVASDVLEA